MSNKPQVVSFLDRPFRDQRALINWLSSVKIQVNAARPAEALECIQIKAILKVELERF